MKPAIWAQVCFGRDELLDWMSELWRGTYLLTIMLFYS